MNIFYIIILCPYGADFLPKSYLLFIWMQV